ncbi:uncharacterized protein LOC114526592 [Dendronephthya gigantea]|uniref:uncharacterized protein LOC114526592 n=1 Tax=Dendronephthya gigantea TaxID=151771 RepID=UPI00106C4C7F|nr:uncharacterized protein LOC114526592 [Dendronephthya gigantea]
MTQDKYYKNFVPKSSTNALPKSIMEYRNPAAISMQPAILENHCQTFKIPELTQSQISTVERETRHQSKSKIWYRQRAGRITASKLKQVLRTNPLEPSKSLVKSICYPESYKFSTAATRHGCKHEAKAIEEYTNIMCNLHDDFSVSESGLWLNEKWPYMGATPDGIVMCSCHGTGLCEIKCPYCITEKENISDATEKKGFCLVKDESVWKKNELYVERIMPDLALWDEIVPKAEVFFRNCILAEVFGRKFTKEIVTALNANN